MQGTKAPTKPARQEQLGVRRLAQGHFDTPGGGIERATLRLPDDSTWLIKVQLQVLKQNKGRIKKRKLMYTYMVNTWNRHVLWVLRLVINKNINKKKRKTEDSCWAEWPLAVNTFSFLCSFLSENECLEIWNVLFTTKTRNIFCIFFAETNIEYQMYSLCIFAQYCT